MSNQTASEPLVVVEKLRKDYGHETVLYLPNLVLNRGELVAVCGGNGAGKSTLIKLLAGISQPEQGRIEVNGFSNPGQRRSYARQIGFMPDDFQAALHVTVIELLTFYAELRQQPLGRVHELLQRVGLESHQNKKVTRLSKGMRQRLMLAQALLASPPLLLLDEPTNGLDPIWTQTFGRLCQELTYQGQTIFFSTHDLHVAKEVADRILFLHKGQVIEEGTVSQLISKYRTEDLYRLFHSLVMQEEASPS